MVRLGTPAAGGLSRGAFQAAGAVPVKRSKNTQDEFKSWSVYHVFLIVYTHIHTYIHTCKHAYRQTYIHSYIHTYRHTHTDIHTYIPTYIHTYIHPYVYNSRFDVFIFPLMIQTSSPKDHFIAQQLELVRRGPSASAGCPRYEVSQRYPRWVLHQQLHRWGLAE